MQPKKSSSRPLGSSSSSTNNDELLLRTYKTLWRNSWTSWWCQLPLSVVSTITLLFAKSILLNGSKSMGNQKEAAGLFLTGTGTFFTPFFFKVVFFHCVCCCCVFIFIYFVRLFVCLFVGISRTVIYLPGCWCGCSHMLLNCCCVRINSHYLKTSHDPTIHYIYVFLME
jgi:hypothetical protein